MISVSIADIRSRHLFDLPAITLGSITILARVPGRFDVVPGVDRLGRQRPVELVVIYDRLEFQATSKVLDLPWAILTNE